MIQAPSLREGFAYGISSAILLILTHLHTQQMLLLYIDEAQFLRQWDKAGTTMSLRESIYNRNSSWHLFNNLLIEIEVPSASKLFQNSGVDFGVDFCIVVLFLLFKKSVKQGCRSFF